MRASPMNPKLVELPVGFDEVLARSRRINRIEVSGRLPDDGTPVFS
jgi:hypothetical protein